MLLITVKGLRKLDEWKEYRYLKNPVLNLPSYDLPRIKTGKRTGPSCSKGG